mmetsp:Transcript_48824/g.110798  ORF Transcript_48824/g.110798 Transcript_48824/m.110798 type:complete len:223 (+) Transcript_48824:310-978(+)
MRERPSEGELHVSPGFGADLAVVIHPQPLHKRAGLVRSHAPPKLLALLRRRCGGLHRRRGRRPSPGRSGRGRSGCRRAQVDLVGDEHELGLLTPQRVQGAEHVRLERAQGFRAGNVEDEEYHVRPPVLRANRIPENRLPRRIPDLGTASLPYRARSESPLFEIEPDGRVCLLQETSVAEVPKQAALADPTRTNDEDLHPFSGFQTRRKGWLFGVLFDGESFN